MSNRTVFESTVNASGPAKAATLATATMTAQSTLDAARSFVGYQEGAPVGNATYLAAVAAAGAALIAARDAAERARQKTFDAARETLRGTGDLSPL